MSNETEKRVFDLQDLEIEERDGKPPVLRGYAAVFNELSQDLGGFREQIAPGAFTEALTRDDVRALFNHDPNFVIGRNRSGTLKLVEDQRGLGIEATPPDTQWARDLIISMKRGDINQMSFAFRVMPNGQDWAKNEEGLVVRTLKRLQLFDVSPVTYPAYTGTSISARGAFDEYVKSQSEDLEQYHRSQNEMRRKRLGLF